MFAAVRPAGPAGAQSLTPAPDAPAPLDRYEGSARPTEAGDAPRDDPQLQDKASVSALQRHLTARNPGPLPHGLDVPARLFALFERTAAQELAPLAQYFSKLAAVIARATPTACLEHMERLPDGPAAQVWRRQIWHSMRPTAPASQEDAPRWRKVGEKATRYASGWDNATAVLLPEHHWHLAARSCVLRSDWRPLSGWPDPYLRRGNVLRACMEGLPLPSGACDPELALVRDPTACVARGDWEPLFARFGAPSWLCDLLHRETVQDAPEALFAQQNRLRALGKILHVCRCIGVDVSAPPTPDFLTLLARVPSQGLRDRLVKDHLRAMVQSPELWAERMASVMERFHCHESRILALTLEVEHPSLMDSPAVQVLLNAGRLAHDGKAWRSLLALFAFEQRVWTRRVVHSGSPERLLPLLRGALQADAPLALAQAYAEGSASDAGPLRAQCQRSENTSRVAAELLQALRHHHQRPIPALTYADAERHRLAASLAWLVTQPPYAAAARALQHLLGMPPRPLALHERGLPAAQLLAAKPAYKAELKAWNSAWGTAKSAAKRSCDALARGPLRRWMQDLVRQVERCFLPAEPEVSATGPCPEPSFYTQESVRTFFNQHVLDLALALTRFAPILMPQRDEPYTCALDVQRRALGFFASDDSSRWDRMCTIFYAPNNLLTYASRTPGWQFVYRDQAERLLREVIDAWLAGTQHIKRRSSRQMQALLRADPAPPWLHTWEEEHTEDAVFNGGDCRIRDSANPGEMLAATTDIYSCQSVLASSFNVGMVNRLACGAKRMLTVRDLEGKLMARAALRLVHGAEGEPVMLLSRIYQNRPAKFLPLLGDYVAHRAKALGLGAAHTCKEGGDIVLRASRSETPDYWDETRALTSMPTTFRAHTLDEVRASCVP